jgi:multidrug efflux pump subunit AcrA (membrane-fusion protein)/YHS domain-containing protein
MRLEPVYANGGGSGAPPDGASLPVGAVRVSTERQQAIGVKLAVAERVGGTRALRTTGRVAPNENAVYPLIVGVESRVRDVRSPTVGTLVRRNEVLATLYAPTVLSSVQNFVQAMAYAQRSGAVGGVPTGSAASDPQRTADYLRDLGFSEGQIEELRKTRQPTSTMQIASPVDGFILLRNVLVGQRLEAGSELYRIADLRRVWIMADVYENQLPFVKSGVTARIVAAQHGREFTAKVSAAQPIFDETTRTMKVRLETDNPGFVLKPGMFVDVDFAIDLPPALAVPADAIVDTGLRKTLFVDRGSGYFEPRSVETGWRIGDQVEVTKGLMPGERIVISGTFLIDSESRMKAAAAGVFGSPVEDVVCGMEVDQRKAAAAGRAAQHDGRTYYFCSDECRRKFVAEPTKYARKPGS